MFKDGRAPISEMAVTQFSRWRRSESKNGVKWQIIENIEILKKSYAGPLCGRVTVI